MRKRLLIILLAFVMIFALIPILGSAEKVFAGTNGHTQAEAVAWANSQVGKVLDYDGVYGAQCVDFTKYYYSYLGQSAPTGNANQYANGGAYTPAGWSYQGSPQPGDVAVWTSGQYGHVAIVTEIRGSQMVCVEQNYANKQYVTANLHNIDANTYIRPDFASPVNHNPVIAFDSVEVKPGQVRVTGWTYDPDDPTRSIDAHVYLFVNGNPTCIGGTTANKSRKDVDNAHHVGEFHGFDATFDTRILGDAEVQVAAINIGEGSNVWSDKKQISVSNPNPVGCIDSVTDNGSSIKVTGWAFDPSDTSKQIEIHVYIGGSSGSNGAEGHNGIIANLERKDVNKAYKCGDYHGFSAVIPTNKLGSQQVYIYGINIGSGWDNTCFGSKTVTITKHNHSLVKIPATSATKTSEGNIEYWKCNGCGRLFKDSAGKIEITKAQTVIPKLTSSTQDRQENEKTDLVALKNLKVKAAKKAATVKWKKVAKPKKIQGIEIEVATDSNFTNVVKQTTAKKTATSKKIKGLKSKKTYWVRVRTYKNTADGKHVSKWTKKKFKTK